jgi:hypothetical protein
MKDDANPLGTFLAVRLYLHGSIIARVLHTGSPQQQHSNFMSKFSFVDDKVSLDGIPVLSIDEVPVLKDIAKKDAG